MCWSALRKNWIAVLHQLARVRETIPVLNVVAQLKQDFSCVWTTLHVIVFSQHRWVNEISLVSSSDYFTLNGRCYLSKSIIANLCFYTDWLLQLTFLTIWSALTPPSQYYAAINMLLRGAPQQRLAAQEDVHSRLHACLARRRPQIKPVIKRLWQTGFRFGRLALHVNLKGLKWFKGLTLYIARPTDRHMRWDSSVVMATASRQRQHH